MTGFERLLTVLYYIFHALSDLCWSGKEVLRELREFRETKKKGRKKQI